MSNILRMGNKTIFYGHYYSLNQQSTKENFSKFDQNQNSLCYGEYYLYMVVPFLTYSYCNFML